MEESFERKVRKLTKNCKIKPISGGRKTKNVRENHVVGRTTIISKKPSLIKQKQTNQTV